MPRPSELMEPLPDHLENDPKTGTDERALLIVQSVVCACGADWTESNIIFKGAGYSYLLTQQRYNALLDGSLRVEGKRVHSRIVPICHNCRGLSLPHEWSDNVGSDDDPHYPYELWPDKHKQKLVKKAQTKKTGPDLEEIRKIKDDPFA